MKEMRSRKGGEEQRWSDGMQRRKLKEWGLSYIVRGRHGTRYERRQSKVRGRR